MRRAVAVLVLALPLFVAAAVSSAPAETRLADVEPAAGALVGGGAVGLSVRTAGADVRIAVDGTELPVSPADGVARATAELGEGSHVADARAVDAAGVEVRRLWRFETSAVRVARLAGADRIGTAVRLSRDRFGAGAAPAAVLARADGFADALAGVPLAAARQAPLLLTGPDRLDDQVAAELTRVLGDDRPVLLLGGEQALGARVASDAAALGLRPLRLGGGDRYETAVLVAAELPSPAPTAVLASGETFPDALAASVPAAVAGWPVLLTRPAALPEPTAEGLRQGGYSHVVVVGGEQAAGAGIEAEIRATAPAVAAVERVAGATRHDTAAALGGRFAGLLDPAGTIALSSGGDFPDALAGGADAAARRAPLLLTDATLPPASAAFLLEHRPPELIAYGGTAALSDDVLTAARAVITDLGGPPTTDPPAGAELAGFGPGTVLSVATDLAAVDASQSAATVTVDGHEVDTVLSAEGGTLRVVVTGLFAPTGGVHTVRLVAAVRGPELTPVRHVAATYTWRPPPLLRTAEGFDLVGGDGPIVGLAGPLRTYSLEVEPATGVDTRAFSAQAELILSDRRGWTARGERRLQRVGATDADLRVVLATPATVDTYCARAGLDTAGRLSCWNGRFAMLNVDRWLQGADAFAAPLEQYQGYLVNHEVGHGLGYGHQDCPQAGALAPVMMQQSIDTGACLPNAWPYP